MNQSEICSEGDLVHPGAGHCERLDERCLRDVLDYIVDLVRGRERGVDAAEGGGAWIGVGPASANEIGRSPSGLEV